MIWDNLDKDRAKEKDNERKGGWMSEKENQEQRCNEYLQKKERGYHL